ncbi:uncharacterized protein LOC143082517 [Mytilus galloprovincialis]|uniref:Adenylate kinase n=1 Tax=Mytilus galloprovincialis TaxID=29158 RepID=A0A8B6F4R7_MYTGA|nr:Hypothetical predicted protein [Mytilus galloprovincialis]
MGCGGSTDSPKAEHGNRRTSIFAKPVVNLEIGENVKLKDSNPRLIFVFGGPGSKKGKMVYNIAQVFGFNTLNVENIILEELAKKIEEPDPSRLTAQVQQLIKAQPELLRLDVVLKWVAKALTEMDKDKTILVDWMPNLKYMQMVSTFVKDCNHEFRFFEDKYPVSFAFYMLISQEKFVKKAVAECAKHPTATPKGKEGAAQTDEADVTRTSKRATLFTNAVKPFIDLFTKTGRLATLDMSTGNADDLWEKVVEFFSELNISFTRKIDNVILFTFTEDDCVKLEIDRYNIDRICIKDLPIDLGQPAEKLIKVFVKLLDTTDPIKKVYNIDCSGTGIQKDTLTEEYKKKIVFQDFGSYELTKFVPLIHPGKVKPTHLKAIASTENELCLFPDDTPIILCHWIVSVMRSARDN